MIAGKIVGAVLGWLTFGPLGVVGGLIVGHYFDLGYRNSLVSHDEAAQIQKSFFVATFTVMGKMAKADGHISKKEINTAEKIMQQLQLNLQQRKQAIELFMRGKDPAYNIEPVVQNFYFQCRRHRDLLQFFLKLQLEAAFADGQMTNEQRRIFNVVCQGLHFSSIEFETMFNQQQAEYAFYNNNNNYQRHNYTSPRTDSSLDEAYSILGVSPQATQQEIKQAYRKLISQYHPDKLLSKGLPKEMMEFAQRKAQKITVAYDTICQAKNY